jgi:hypothetical protein
MDSPAAARGRLDFGISTARRLLARVEHPWVQSVFYVRCRCHLCNSTGEDCAALSPFIVAYRCTLYEISSALPKQKIRSLVKGLSHPFAIRGSAMIISWSYIDVNVRLSVNLRLGRSNVRFSDGQSYGAWISRTFPGINTFVEGSMNVRLSVLFCETNYRPRLEPGVKLH